MLEARLELEGHLAESVNDDIQRKAFSGVTPPGLGASWVGRGEEEGGTMTVFLEIELPGMLCFIPCHAFANVTVSRISTQEE